MTLEKGWQAKFIKRLAETANVSAACKRAKCSRQEAYRTRDEDAEFDGAWKEALEIATEALELEARRRAEKGVLEPVFFQGVKAGAIRRYSDTLMIFLLKAHKPEIYRDKLDIKHSGHVGFTADDAAQAEKELDDFARRKADLSTPEN